MSTVLGPISNRNQRYRINGSCLQWCCSHLLVRSPHPDIIVSGLRRSRLALTACLVKLSVRHLTEGFRRKEMRTSSRIVSAVHVVRGRKSDIKTKLVGHPPPSFCCCCRCGQYLLIPCDCLQPVQHLFHWAAAGGLAGYSRHFVVPSKLPTNVRQFHSRERRRVSTCEIPISDKLA